MMRLKTDLERLTNEHGEVTIRYNDDNGTYSVSVILNPSEGIATEDHAEIHVATRRLADEWCESIYKQESAV